ncbi:hypothetical protein ACIRRA_25055 [Nocardia sp. NPDC101769]|uniref:hypothetical protein n=1 Tax=Nocardia sp. NPDC101769 TaxID=3364333 RepID=UPI00382F8405
MTMPPDDTASQYRREIGILAKAIVAHRLPEPAAEDADATAEAAEDSDGAVPGQKSADRNGSPLTCRREPPRRIRAHKKIIAAGPILCGLYGQPFTQ